LSWNAALPTTGSKMVDTATIYPDNWVAIEEWVDLEHYNFSEANSGRHAQGEVAVMSASTTTVVTSATILSSTPGSGAVAWSTDRGHLLYYLASWSEAPKTYQECDANVYLKTPSPSSFSSGDTFLLKWDTEDNDPYAEYASGAAGVPGYFVAKATGKYLAISTFSFNPVTFTDLNCITIYLQSVTGSTVTKTLSAREYIMIYEGDSANATSGTMPAHTLQLVGTFELTATNLIQSYATSTCAVAASGADGIRTTCLSIKRME